MLFNSFVFIGFLLITFFLYYLPILKKYQVQVLISASLFFYSYQQPSLLFLLLFSALINIVFSFLVLNGQRHLMKIYATIGVIINVLILFFFKYTSLVAKLFFAENDSIGSFFLNIPLPIGISFYTFQGISLMIDVFRNGNFNNIRNNSSSFIDYGKHVLLFKSFFPQLIAGPIVKAHDFIPQIKSKSFDGINWEFVFRCLITGYFLKMVVADNLKDFTYWISFPFFQGYSSLTLLTMLFGYSCQIFADFAGYSLIAIGLANLFGYHFFNNFDFPYFSRSFKEFWRRWHISLSSFLKEYLYIPLGGNRLGNLRTNLNLLLVMIIGGFWHGADWSYAIWGLFHGLALVVEKLIMDNVKIKGNKVISIFKILLTFCLVTFAWILFKLPNFAHVIEFFKCLYNNFGQTPNYQLITYTLIYSFPVFLYHLYHYLKLKKYLTDNYDFILFGIMLFLIITNSGSTGSFIYFQF